MDPTETELKGMADLNGVYDWAGLADDVRTKLGLEQVVENLKGLGPVRDGAPRAERDLTHVERGRLAMVRRVCFLRLGANPDGSNATGAPTQQLHLQPVSGLPLGQGR